MQTTTAPDARTIGSFESTTAFDVARELEHAGIHADVTVAAGAYQVTVAARDYDRALRRI